MLHTEQNAAYCMHHTSVSGLYVSDHIWTMKTINLLLLLNNKVVPVMYKPVMLQTYTCIPLHAFRYMHTVTCIPYAVIRPARSSEVWSIVALSLTFQIDVAYESKFWIDYKTFRKYVKFLILILGWMTCDILTRDYVLNMCPSYVVKHFRTLHHRRKN